MNNTYIPTAFGDKPFKDYSGIIFSRVVYDNRMPVMHIVSMAEALRQRKVDVLKIIILTEKAKRTLEQISRKG